MNRVGDILSGAVPDLPAPPDRVAEVGARVRRRRRLVGVGVAVLAVVGVGVAIGVPQLLGSRGTAVTPAASAPPRPLVVGADSCPGQGTDFTPTDTELPGPLVPDGAVEVALCELMAQGEQPAPRVLTTGVAEHVAVLNGLPGKRRYLELISAKNGVPVNEDSIGCTLIGFNSELSLRLRYADRDPVFVLLDRNCATARVGDTTRYWWTNPLADFYARYRGQLASTTDHASIKAPTCTPTIGLDTIRQETSPSGPVDGIAANRYGTDVLLPNALHSARLCRYAVDGSGARVTTQQAVPPAGLGALRDLLNAQFEKDRNGPKQQMVECGSPNQPLPTRLDVVVVTDVTGGTSELWFVRAPCTAAITAGYAGLAPTPGMLNRLDQSLA